MTRAFRFAAVNTVAEAVADMLDTIAYENSVEGKLNEYETYMDGFFDSEGYPISRSTVEYYMNKHNCGVVEAVELYSQSEQRITESNMAWLADPANWGSEIYSDIYKDTYGFRPRW